MAKKSKKSAPTHDALLKELVAEFTTEHKGDAEALVGGSPLLDSAVTIRIPTGCPNLNAMMQGGFPGGRIVQLYGDFSTGKSTIALSGLKWCTENGGVGVLIDPENGFDAERYARSGGNPDKLILLQKAFSTPKAVAKTKTAKKKGLPAMTVQDVFKYIYDILNSIASKPSWKGKPVMVVLDSLDNITTDEALEDGKQGMTAKPRLIREGFRHITDPIGKSKAAFVIVSQVIENIGGYGPKYVTAGGGGPKFISSIRLNTWRIADYPVYADKRKSGNILVRTTATKSKLFRPYVEAVTAINNDSTNAFEGVDEDYSLLYMLEGSKTQQNFVLQKPGVAYRYIYPTGELAAKHGFAEGQEIAFLPNQWRETLRQWPPLRGYLLDLCQSMYAKPPIFNPQAETESEEQ